MTEDKAKQILDFLARKIGYDEVVINHQFALENNTNAYVLGCKKLNDIHFLYIWSNDMNTITLIGCSNPMSYAEALENMLEISKDTNIYSGFINKLFLHAHASLEEILVEMDLKI